MASTFQYRLMNSSLMRKYQNTPGRMFVKIFEAACGGKQFQASTTDKQTITVELKTPIDQPLQGWIEIIGMPVSNSVFKANEIICFEQNENQEPFDDESHNEVCQLFDILRENDLYKYKI